MPLSELVACIRENVLSSARTELEGSVTVLPQVHLFTEGSGPSYAGCMEAAGPPGRMMVPGRFAVPRTPPAPGTEPGKSLYRTDRRDCPAHPPTPDAAGRPRAGW